MNIVRKDTDGLTAQLFVQIDSSDYSEKVENKLKEYKRKANVPGFRPGMVPVGLLKKMYGKSILVEEVNQIVSEAIDNYLKNNDIKLLGEVLPNTTDQKPVRFDFDEVMEFVFDFAEAPKITLELTKEDVLPYYEIAVDETLIDKQIQSIRERMASTIEADIVEENDLVKGSLEELTETETKRTFTDSQLKPNLLKNEVKTLIIGKKVGENVSFNPTTAFHDEKDAAMFLNVQVEELKKFDADFQFTIEHIDRYQPHPLDQELFDLVYGKDTVTTEAEAREKEKEVLQEIMVENSFYRFQNDFRSYILQKLSDLPFPEPFLKRWIKESNKKISEEVIEKEFNDLLDLLRWQLFRNQFAVTNEIKVDAADLKSYIKRNLKSQYAQYGITNFPDDLLEGYVQDILQKDEEVEKYFESVLNEKVTNTAKEKVTLNKIPISLEDFQALPR
ncbi:MAG: trigger factor [Microbacter sp.]